VRRAVPAVLAGAAALLTACDRSAVVCPAIAYGSTLVVRLAADWPPDGHRSVQVDCGSPCELPTGSSVPGTGSQARVVMFDPPDSLTVTVSDASGPLTSVEVEPTWNRVEGSEECGGPIEATVTVAAP
jgi:hypothetical protein